MIPGTSLTQKTALLPVQTRPPPYVAPDTFGDELLSWPQEGAGVLQCTVDVLVAENSPAHLQPLFEKLVMQVIGFRVCGHDGQYDEV